MESYVCHDLKTPRGEISSGLPPIYKVVPGLFYLTLVGCSLAMGLFELERGRAVVQARISTAEGATFQGESARIAKERANVEALNKRATEVAKWVEGALNLQPVCVAVSRAAGKDATISELSLTRNTELPSQVHLELKVNNADSAVMDATLQGIRGLDFRAYSAQQNKELDQLDYKATLVWQNTQSGAVSK